MGKTKEALLDTLHHLGGSATDREVAIAISRQKRVRFVRKHLDELVSEYILTKSGSRSGFHPDFRNELVFTREITGEAEADERDKARHQAQREHYQWLLKTGKINGGSTAARRGRRDAAEQGAATFEKLRGREW